MTGLRVYIAGPMTGLPEFNYPAFDRAAEALRSMGHEPLNPADIGKEFGMDHPRVFYMREAIAMLLTCDAMCLLPGWLGSSGAVLEAQIAMALDMDAVELPLEVTLGLKAPTNVSTADMTTEGIQNGSGIIAIRLTPDNIGEVHAQLLNIFGT